MEKTESGVQFSYDDYDEIEEKYPEIKALIQINRDFIDIVRDSVRNTDIGIVSYEENFDITEEDKGEKDEKRANECESSNAVELESMLVRHILVSVVIPVYNAEKYLEETVGYIIKQTLEDIEIILVNDGSTDNSLNIMNKLTEQDDRISVITQQNQGGGAARNTGLKFAHGEYVVFLDADDIFHPEMLECSYKYAKSNNADIVFWDFASLESDGKIIHNQGKKNNRENVNLANHDTLYYRYTNPAPWNKLFRLDFIKRYNILFQPLSSCNDIGFVVSALYLAESVFYLDREFVTYRRNIGVISDKRYQKSENILKAGQYIINHLDLYRENNKFIYQAMIPSFVYEYKQFPKREWQSAALFLSKVYRFLPVEYHQEFNYRLYKISIIICINTNTKEEKVKNCIESLESQTLNDKEIICIASSYDDHDSILSMISAYGIKYIQHSIGENLFETLGLQYAKGEFILFSECISLEDDMYLEDIYKSLKQNKSNGRVYRIKSSGNKCTPVYTKNYTRNIRGNNTVVPNVSIIVPTYNCEPFLEKCIQSLLNQTETNIEIICIDDGSTDNSLQIIKMYAQFDERFRFISHANIGQGASRNIALSISRGKYIIFVDADDWLDLDSVKELYTFAKKNKTDMLSYSGRNVKDGVFIKNNYWEYIYIPKELCNTNNSQNMIFTKEDIIQYSHCLPVSCCLTMYDFNFIQKNNIRFPENLRFEDNCFFTKAICKCERYAIYKKYFYNRLVRREQTTQRFDETIFDYFQTFEMSIQEYLQRSPAPTQEQATKYISIKLDRLLSLREQVPPEIQAEYDKRFVFFLKKIDFKVFDRLIKYLLDRLRFHFLCHIEERSNDFLVKL